MLTPRQAVFVAEYVVDFNGARAAIQAGYSRRSAREQARENLTKPAIQQALAARLRPRIQKLGLTLMNTLEEYRRLAYAHLGESYEEADGELKPFDEWPKARRREALRFLEAKRRALSDVLEYLRHAGVYGQPRTVAPNAPSRVIPVSEFTEDELVSAGDRRTLGPARHAPLR